MKKFLFLAITALMGATAVAQDNTPYGPALAEQIRKINNDNSDGEKVVKVARATYDVAINGATSGSSYGLGVYLPANAILTQSYMYVVTQFADSGTGQVAFKCEDAGNIFTAADITGYAAGSVIKGNQTGGTDSMTAAISDKCELTATVTGATQTSGKLILFVQYVVGQ